MKQRNSAFSLIELTIAIALVSTIVLGFIGVMAMGVKAASDSTRRTVLGAIVADVHHRMEGARMREGDLDGSPFYYDGEGRFIPPETEEKADETEGEERYKSYRVDVRLAAPHQSQVADRYGDKLPISKHAKGLMAAVIEVHWPLDENGEVGDDTHNTESMTYFVNTLTGPSWEAVDSQFEPEIEF